MISSLENELHLFRDQINTKAFDTDTESCFFLIKVHLKLMIVVMRSTIYVVINMVTAKDIQQVRTRLVHHSKWDSLWSEVTSIVLFA